MAVRQMHRLPQALGQSTVAATLCSHAEVQQIWRSASSRASTANAAKIKEQPDEPYPIKDKGMSYKVPSNRPALVTKQWNVMTRRLRNEGFVTRVREAQRYTKPSDQRLVDDKALESKLSRQKFKTIMDYIMKRKERGF